MTVPSNIKRIRKAAQLTQEQLAGKLGVARSTVTQWENGWSNPRMSMVQKLSSALGVPAGAIVGDGGIGELERRVIAAEASGSAASPLLGRVHAGLACEPDILDEHVQLPYSIARLHEHAFFLEVEGDCMNRVYPEGCLILVDPDVEAENDSIVVASIDNGDYVVRRLFRTSQTLVLSADSWNPDHNDIIIRSDDARTVVFHGTVVWFQARRELV